MALNNPLFLQEEILLLALKDEKGTIAAGTMYQYAVGGAILSELLLRKHISIDKSSKRKYLNLENSTSIGDPLLDECLQKIARVKRRATLETWVSRFANIKSLKHRVADQLVKHGILRKDEDKVLFIFSRKIYPEVNPQPEKEIIERLRKIIFEDSDDFEARTVILLSLAKSADLLRLTFDKKELKNRKKRIEKIINGELIGKAAHGAIEAVQAAAMVAAIMPAIMASTMSSSVSA
jgi:golgi phosphoprotein 3